MLHSHIVGSEGGKEVDWYLAIPIAVALLGSIFFSIVLGKKEPVDKGFAFSYHRLSYRRKMIRTFTELPIGILAFFVIYYFTDWNQTNYILLGLFFLLGGAIQFFYNYYMWRKHEYEKKDLI
jgi:hypothetical protein